MAIAARNVDITGLSNVGAVYVYDWNAGAGQWQQVGIRIPGKDADETVRNVAISGDGQRVMLSGRTADSRGRVEVYRLVSGTWTIMGSPITGATAGSSLGVNTAMGNRQIAISDDGNRIIMGERLFDGPSLTDNGQLRTYDWNSTTSTWVASTFFQGSASNNLLGSLVALSGDGQFAAVLETLTSRVTPLRRNAGGTAWVARGSAITLSSSTIRTIALSGDGNTLLIGTGLDTRLYRFNGTNFVLIKTISHVSGVTSVITAQSDLNQDGSILAIQGASFSPDQTNIRTFRETCVIAPGECKTATFVYDASTALANTAAEPNYDFDVILNADKIDPAHDAPIINPDQNFTTQTGGFTGDGWKGSNHTEDDVTILDDGFCESPKSLTITTVIEPTTVCEAGFATATITIINPYPVAITGTSLNLNLGNGAKYVSEPYDRLFIVMPTFPGLEGNTGSITIPIFSLGAGVSIFKVDIAVPNGVNTLSAQLIDIDPAYNNGSTTTALVSDNITGQASPTFTGTCPANITFGTTSINLNYTVSGASNIQWSSGSNGVFSNPTSGTTTYTVNALDLANGFMDFALTAKSSAGCDNSIICRVNIANVPRDYGDAPITYDLGTSTIPVAAANTLVSGLHLGASAPDSELQNQPSSTANAEPEDDGLSSTSLSILPTATTFNLPIKVTNTTASIAYANAFIDWNQNGDFLDDNETGTEVTVPASSGTNTYNVSFTVPSGITLPFDTYVRLRVAQDAADVRRPFSVAVGGEVEDFYVSIAGAVTITGRVFNDINGNTIIDSSEVGTTGGTNLFVYLVDSITGIVKDSMRVNSDGTYILDGESATKYVIILSRFLYPIGHNNNFNAILTTPPSNFITTGENGNNNTGPGDLSPDGKLSLTTGTTNVTNQNFGITPPVILGDMVWIDLNNNGILDDGTTNIQGGLTINLYRDADNNNIPDGGPVATITSEVDGTYRFPGLIPGNYIVGAVLPANHTIVTTNGGDPDNDINNDNNGVNLVSGEVRSLSITLISGTEPLNSGRTNITLDIAIRPFQYIGDRVWLDVNRNGIQDFGESGLPGVKVELYNTSDVLQQTTYTANNGSYYFAALPGTYYVKFSDLPSGLTFTTPSLGGNPALDSDPNPSTGNTANITLTSGVDITTIDAGVMSAAGVGNFVWNDLNNNGQQDVGEPGISGVFVGLYNSADDSIVGAAITNSLGNYFIGSNPGNYYLKVNVPSGYNLTTQAASGVPSSQNSDANTSTFKTNTFALSTSVNNDLDFGLVLKPNTIVACGNVPLRYTDINSNIVLDKFVPSSGQILTNVAIDYNAITLNPFIGIENQGSGALSSYNLVLNSFAKLILPNADSLVVNNSTNTTLSFGAYDGITNFQGTSGYNTIEQTKAGSATDNPYLPTTDFLWTTGPTTVSLPFTTRNSNSLFSGGGNFTFLLRTMATAGACVSYTYEFEDVIIEGSVFNDANGNTIINSGETFTTLPAPLYVYLVDSSGIVVDSANVLPNGSYTMAASPNQTYTIELSTV